MIDHITHHGTSERFDFGLAELSLHAEEIESLDAPSWGRALAGFAIGFALGAAPVVALAIT
jgi:hypothetical protein